MRRSPRSTTRLARSDGRSWRGRSRPDPAQSPSRSPSHSARRWRRGRLRLVASDVSPDALALAAENLARPRRRRARSASSRPTCSTGGRRVRGRTSIVANLPYVSSAEVDERHRVARVRAAHRARRRAGRPRPPAPAPRRPPGEGRAIGAPSCSSSASARSSRSARWRRRAHRSRSCRTWRASTGSCATRDARLDA